MSPSDLTYLVFGLALLVAVVLPIAISRVALSAPLLLVGLGCLLGPLPVEHLPLDPIADRAFTEHLTEATVVVALMGVGLALDRPLRLRGIASWARWSSTWRLLLVAMPLTIAAVALVGSWLVGLAPAAALLLGAALAPTDPVLASDVQVQGPGVGNEEDAEEEDDDVRFALTSEAGFNDALAFPFVYAAILLAAAPVGEWGLEWVGFYLVGKIAIGTVVGGAVGWGLAKVAFGARRPSLAVARRGEPLLALAALLTAYGVAEVCQGYGFLAVFVAALTMRSFERAHDYHALMHQMIERLEHLLTLAVLLLLGLALTNGLLGQLRWEGALLGVLLVFVIRPLAGWAALAVHPRTCGLDAPERWVVGFFGVRGVGSIYYLAYAAGEAHFADLPQLWSTVAFTIVLSVVVHGVLATPAMNLLERRSLRGSPESAEPTRRAGSPPSGRGR